MPGRFPTAPQGDRVRELHTIVPVRRVQFLPGVYEGTDLTAYGLIVTQNRNGALDFVRPDGRLCTVEDVTSTFAPELAS